MGLTTKMGIDPRIFYSKLYFQCCYSLIQLSLSLNANEIQNDSLFHTISFETKFISSQVHDQNDSFLCWAFSLCTMLATELKLLVLKLCHIEKKISKELSAKLLRDIS